MATIKPRMTVYLSPALTERVKAQAENLGISKSAVVQLAVEAGIKSIELARNPEWQAYFAKMIREGKPLTLPDGSIFGSEEL